MQNISDKRIYNIPILKIVTIFKKLTLKFSIFEFNIVKSHSALGLCPHTPRLLFLPSHKSYYEKSWHVLELSNQIV